MGLVNERSHTSLPQRNTSRYSVGILRLSQLTWKHWSLYNTTFTSKLHLPRPFLSNLFFRFGVKIRCTPKHDSIITLSTLNDDFLPQKKCHSQKTLMTAFTRDFWAIARVNLKISLQTNQTYGRREVTENIHGLYLADSLSASQP